MGTVYQCSLHTVRQVEGVTSVVTSYATSYRSFTKLNLYNLRYEQNKLVFTNMELVVKIVSSKRWPHTVGGHYGLQNPIYI